MKPLVAIVGRPNVGKSALFNRLIQRRLAIVEGVPGITRDRIYAETDWAGRSFRLVDTGGLEPGMDKGMVALVRYQAEAAIREADVIIFVVDAREGVTAVDRDVAELLRRSGKPVVLAANKVDDAAVVLDTYEFFALGLGEPLPVSAEHGRNTGDLLDLVVAHFPAEEPEEEDAGAIRVAVVGRPNVGKSSLVNRLLGQERVIVSEMPGTTRDAVDVEVETDRGRLVFVDTAGLRRKSRIEDPVERYSVLRALRAVDHADVVLVMLDATETVTEQDKKVAGYGHDQGKAAVLVVNKWDLIEKDERTATEYTRLIRRELAFVDYAPVVFVSALTGQRVDRIIDLAFEVAARHRSQVPTGVLNRVIHAAQEVNPAPRRKGKKLQIYYGTQVRSGPPTFAFFVNDPELVHFSYVRYLDRTLREAFDFEGTPLRLFFRRSR